MGKKKYRKKEGGVIRIKSTPELLDKAKAYAETEMPKFSKAFERMADE